MTTDNRSDSEDFTDLFLNNTPLIDLRAAIEFSQGAFPSATNLPLMTFRRGRCRVRF